MRHVIVVVCSLVLLSSCRKDVREYTSDFQDQYKTNIQIYYNATTNMTSVGVTFLDPIYYYTPGPLNTLQLPPNCELKVNGEDLIWNSSYYSLDFEGKSNCNLEFIDADGAEYVNNIVPPDSVYFINFPDTVSSMTDFQFQVNALQLDSNESDEVCLDGHGDDYGCYYYGTDSIITLDAQFLDESTTHMLFLYRNKQILNPNLPLGGGGISYSYRVQKSFYSQ